MQDRLQEIAGQRGDLDATAYGHGASAQGTVDLLVGRQKCLNGFATHECFQRTSAGTELTAMPPCVMMG
jgi:hypothetical protein